MECVEKHGTNIAAAIKPDGNVLVIAVSSGRFAVTGGLKVLF